MDEESKCEKRSFIVGRAPSVDRRCRPRPERQVRLFNGIEETSGTEEYCDENSDPQVTSSSEHRYDETDASTSENALVYLRMRPLERPSTVYCIQGNVLVVKPSSETSSTSHNKNMNDREFLFSDIFHPDIPQSSVYENCVRLQIELEESFTLLTYGTSGSGKTYTLLGDDKQPGMILRALEQIFLIYDKNIYPTPSIKLINGRITLIEDNEMGPDMQTRKQLLRDCVETPEVAEARAKIINDHHFNSPSTNEDCSVLIWISFVEVYNENVYDLLEPPVATTTKMGPPTRRNLKVIGNDGKVFIKDVTSVYVKNTVEAIYLLRYGLRRVNYASTSINSNSSRSHCVFYINLLKFYRSGQFTETSYKFCDLAGSERLHKTGNVGSRLKEAQRINTSLMVLGRCFDAATSSRKKSSSDIIPYRESKLTMLLQSALLGKEKLTMIVNVMPTERYYEENMNVLSFASIATNIVARPPPIKKPKTRCSFLVEFSQNQANQTNSNKEQFYEVLEENIFLRSELERVMALLEEEKNRLALAVDNREREIRQKLADLHAESINKLKIHYENRLQSALASQKIEMDLKYQTIIRKLEWRIEDLEEELYSKNKNNSSENSSENSSIEREEEEMKSPTEEFEERKEEGSPQVIEIPTEEFEERKEEGSPQEMEIPTEEFEERKEEGSPQDRSPEAKRRTLERLCDQ